MTRKEKIALWVSAAIGLVVLVWVWLSRRGAVGATDSAPNYLNYNYPGVGPWKGSGNGLPSVPADYDSGCCGCGSGGPQMFNGIQSMLNYFTSKSSGIFNQYENDVYASYPDTLTQYFNNPTAANQSIGAQQVFGQ